MAVCLHNWEKNFAFYFLHRKYRAYSLLMNSISYFQNLKNCLDFFINEFFPLLQRNLPISKIYIPHFYDLPPLFLESLLILKNFCISPVMLIFGKSYPFNKRGDYVLSFLLSCSLSNKETL